MCWNTVDLIENDGRNIFYSQGTLSQALISVIRNINTNIS